MSAGQAAAVAQRPDMYDRVAEPHGYAVLCTEAGGYRFVIGGFSAHDSAENFATDPRVTRYACGLSESERADLFARFEREVVMDLARTSFGRVGL